MSNTKDEIAVLFDWNGTVVLDAARARDSLNRVLADRDMPELDDAGFSEEFSLPMADMFARLGVPGADTAESEWNRHMMSEVAPGRQGSDVIRGLKEAGTRLGVVSAAAHAAVVFDMEHLDLKDCWSSVDAPASDKVAILRERRGQEATAYYVGDTVYDITSAIAAGYVPIAVDHGYTARAALEAAGARYVISSFDELPDVLGAAAR